MAINHTSGFTLLIAVIFMAVVLALGLSLASLSYKQSVLASSALESQTAFYAADAGLECALRALQEDQAGSAYPAPNNSVFYYQNYNPDSPNPSSSCGTFAYMANTTCYDSGVGGCAGNWELSWVVPLDFPDPINAPRNTEQACAVIDIYEPIGHGTVYLFSQGYDVRCNLVGQTGARYASRGLSATFPQ